MSTQFWWGTQWAWVKVRATGEGRYFSVGGLSEGDCP